jgi:PKD repeat protein
LQYTWDTNGDGKADNQTVTPETTLIYDRQGIYQVTVSIKLDNGETRKATKRLVIPSAVFSLMPARPIVEKPVRFSVAALLPDLKTLSEVQWDFDGDGNMDQTTKTPDVLYTYYATGTVEATAVVKTTTNTQTTYKRLFTVENPPVLPFPVTLTTEPRMLIGPAPFGAIFKIETQEPLKEIQWVFGDGKEEKGSDLKRIGHSFESPGIYSVQTNIRSAKGELAQITTLVRATQELNLSDLRFTGTPEVKSDTVTGEVPLSVELTPQTSTPLIEFSWDDPEAGDDQPRGSTVKQTYRREGTYTLTLIAQDPEGKVMRKNITVKVQPPSAEPTIRIQPDGGVAPLDVILDASDTFIPAGQQIAGFKWRFGDELGSDSEQLGASRVEHTYTQAGEYVIQLTIVMADGKEYTASRTLVVRKPSLSACMTSSRTKVQAGKGISFDADCSTGAITRYLWDVRKKDVPDVPVAQGADPQYIHVFEEAGEYTVSLIVSDASGNQDKKTLSISVTP